MTMTSATPQRLYLMQLSTTIIPLATGQTLAMSSGCYLVQTSDEKNILIDSGLCGLHATTWNTTSRR